MTLGYDEPIRGVNLGNWLVLEKWMMPSIFAASGEEDEIWMQRSLPTAKLQSLLRQHRDSYITEQDFADIAAHGYNLVRLPVPFFVFGESPLPEHQYGTYTVDWRGLACIDYVDAAFAWAKQYGLQILLDLHTVPDSQNGYDNGGITGVCKWAQQPQYVAFALHVLEQLAHRYRHHPALWGIEVLNEPISSLVYATASSSKQAKNVQEAQGSEYVHTTFLHKFYRVAYQRLRKILSPQTVIVFHDGFRLVPMGLWLSIQPMHHVMLDTHMYMCSLDMNLAALRNLTHGTWDLAPTKWMYRAYMAINALGLRIVRSRLLPHRVPVVVGEWNIVHSVPQQNNDKRRVRQSYRYIAQLQQKVWKRYTAGAIYWNYQCERDIRKEPKHYATGDSLHAWDIRHVWSNGWDVA